MISAMTLLVILLVALLAATYTVYLLRVIADDDRGHAFTHHAPPRSHAAHDDSATP
jgi:hypothetical protein